MLFDAFVRRRRFIILVVLSILSLAVLSDQIRSPDKRRIGWLGLAVEGALAPAAAGLSRVADVITEGWTLVTEIGRLRTENARLAAEVARLREENARLQDAAQEAVRLRALLALKDHPYRTVSARMIGRDPGHWFETLLVDRGLADGIRRNDPVLTSDGLVGHVIETAGSWARVLLIVDPRSAVGVFVGKMRDADIRPGDVVVTAGLGEIYPRGLPVGTVVTVTRTAGDLFQEALVRPGADLNHVEEMLILVAGAPQLPR